MTSSEEYQLLIKRFLFCYIKIKFENFIFIILKKKIELFRQTIELESLQKRHREELERFQQQQLHLLQQQQASAFHQHQHLYHSIPGNFLNYN